MINLTLPSPILSFITDHGHHSEGEALLNVGLFAIYIRLSAVCLLTRLVLVNHPYPILLSSEPDCDRLHRSVPQAIMFGYFSVV